jgi:hypothetical protein
MRKQFLFLLFSFPLLIPMTAESQSVFPVSSWESLFQWAELDQTGFNTNPILRYTIVLNYGQYVHANFNNSIGLYSGLAVRNVGFIYDTDVPTKTIRRSYTLGIPLALKLGLFDKHFYVFSGGEYELLFHYKGKRWNSNDRNGTKIKDTEWFSAKTERFVPSWFIGIQFPRGFNVKYKMYLGDFLNLDYVGNDLGVPNVSFSDYTELKMHYISLCWQFRTDQWRKYVPVDKVADNN